jgi:tetratricopeptide (TPR) repeat protein
MQALFSAIESRLEGFVKQRDDAFLVVRAGATEAIAMQKILEGLEQKLGDVFWLFGPPFEDARLWVTQVVDEYCMRVDAVSQRLVFEGQEPLPGLMPTIFNPTVTPALRLRWLCEHARSLVEDLEGSKVIFGWMPATIANPQGFAQLMREFCLGGDALGPADSRASFWFAHMRFVIREDAAASILHDEAKVWPRTQCYAPDLGADAIEKSLEDEANDPGLPLERRMQSLFVLAGMDVGYNRPVAAVEKFDLLAHYHRCMSNQALYALSLNGIGEAFARAGDRLKAQNYFERALAPAVAIQDPSVLVPITTNLANLHLAARDYVPAYEHFAALSALATAVQSEPLKVLCHRYMGFCLHQTGQQKAAHDEWRAGAVLALGSGDPDGARPCLEHLRDLFKELGLFAQEQQVQAELAQLDQMHEAQGGLA